MSKSNLHVQDTILQDGKPYYKPPAITPCPLITIKGKVYCVQKDCYYRKIGANCPPEAPIGWKTTCDLLIEIEENPDNWIKGER